MKKLFSLILVLGLLFGGNANAETIIHCKHFKDNSLVPEKHHSATTPSLTAGCVFANLVRLVG